MSSPFGDLTPQEIAGEIWKVMKSEICVCWVGSGLSNLFYKDWPGAVDCLCRNCSVPPWPDSGRKASPDQLIDKAEECKRADCGSYEATLASLFGDHMVPTRQAFSWLIKAPFKAYVTTNFDPLLSEAAAVFGYEDVFSYPLLPPTNLALKKKPLFYVHGHARRNGVPTGRDLVLARSEFDEAYAGTARTFFEALLLEYPIVFIGCRLLEPEVNEQLRRVHEMHTRIKRSRPEYIPPFRLAILPARFQVEEKSPAGFPPSYSKRERNLAEEWEEVQRFRALDTVVLRYAPVNPDKHWEIEDILKETCRIAETSPIVNKGEATLR